MIEQFELAPDALPWIHLVWLAPVALALTMWALARRQAVLHRFGHDRERSADWLRSLRRRRWRKAWLLAGAFLFLAAAAVQPRANPERTRIKTSARDLAVVLDVSRSMLADDIKPSRLERAKLELKRMVKALGGDRVGLVIFAGTAVIKSPLTSSYTSFERTLDSVDYRSAPQGGTRIGDAVRKALSDLLGASPRAEEEDKGPRVGETVLAEEARAKRQSFADILLITDGEDMDSYPVHAAKAAAAADVGIYAVGLGSEEGSTILVQGEGGKLEPLRSREGELVRSRLDSKTLQEMVNSCPRGQYLPVGTQAFDLVSFYESTIAKEGGREVYDEQVFWTEIFQPFLIAGLVLYVASLLLGERPRGGRLHTLEVTP